MARHPLSTRTADEWLELFKQTNVGADPFLHSEEFMGHTQMIENGRIAEIEDSKVGRTIQVGPLAQFSDPPSSIGTPAPLVGSGWSALAADARAKGVPQAVKSAKKLPLEGVTVVESAFFIAAPYSLTLLAEMGARVIKVEPPAGDPMRFNSPYCNIGKESIVLDLKNEEGKKALHCLIKNADVFLHNFRPGVPESLGIDYDTLAGINPRLVYLYAAAYGSWGPESKRPAFHSTPNALAGGGVLEAGDGNRPVDRSYPDPASALGVATAAMLALHARELTGRGQYVETMMLVSTGYALSPWCLLYDSKPADAKVDGGQHGFGPLHRLYETRDGWLFLQCAKPSHWEALANTLGLPHSAEGAEAQRRIEARLTERSASEWERILLAAGVPAVCADSTRLEDFIFDDPHSREAGVAIEVDFPGYGRIWSTGPKVQFSDVARPQPTLPALGEHSARILREFGYADAEIQRLTRNGVTKIVVPA